MADINSEDPIIQQISDSPLDTPQSDAAIADIVAQDADELLAAEDNATAELAEDSATDEPVEHGHPIFWTIIALLVILALFFMYVLLTPGLSLPF